MTQDGSNESEMVVIFLINQGCTTLFIPMQLNCSQVKRKRKLRRWGIESKRLTAKFALQPVWEMLDEHGTPNVTIIFHVQYWPFILAKYCVV